MMIDDVTRTFQQQQEKLNTLGNSLDVQKLRGRIREIDEMVAAEGFWDDQKAAQTVLQERRNIERELERYEQLTTKAEDIETWLEMAKDDESVLSEAEKELSGLTEALADWQQERMLSDEDDHRNALLEIHPGAGGTESQDWGEMLFRMFMRFADRRGYKAQVLDYQDGDEAGVKSATIGITGENAYGYLKSENGVHRLVRISPFDSQSRRHTSFCAVKVIPEIDDDIEVEVNEGDLRIDTYRSSGAGGQHVNVTDSAVRITHEPTGIVVTCQNQRSQHQNREVAMRVLKAKLYQAEREKREAAMAEKQGEQKKIEWGSQIRSYVLHPYQMVKDHRTNAETGNTTAVLDGDLDLFIRSYLLHEAGDDASS